MSVALPTVEQLAQLPLRAVVAYAARNAQRLSVELRGVVPNESFDKLLDLIASVSTTDVNELDWGSVIRAAEELAAAYAAAPAPSKSLAKLRVVFALGHAAETAMFAILAARNPKFARDAAEEAHQTVRHIGAIFPRTAVEAAKKAARQDFNDLLREYGAHAKVVIGDPVRCFDESAGR
jgi:hypothetical protein